MNFFIQYLKQRRTVICAFVLFCMIFAASFALYHLPLAPVVYPSLLCFLAAICYVFHDVRKTFALHKELQRLSSLSTELLDALPVARSMESEDYQMMIRALCNRLQTTLAAEHEKQNRLTNYYTIWGHQIKTPIATMRLQLQNEDSPLSRALSLELRRIEQYVETLLACLRLGSDTTDYVFREYELDGIVRQAVRRFAGEFISRKLTLHYEPLSIKVVTDEKWLTFVIEQLLSNALKYTKEGGVSIFQENNSTLCIRDTGLGIAPEDLPRIFENGYTGLNGRIDKKASGLGLHLCKRILSSLGYGVSLESNLGNGTIVRIDLSQKKSEVE